MLVFGALNRALPRAQTEAAIQRLLEIDPGMPTRLETIALDAASAALHDDHVAENRHHLQALHQRLRAGEFDASVHRGFDLRGQLGEGLRLAAVLKRDSPYDALMASRDITLDELEDGARVGVVQLRARALLAEYRPELESLLLPGDVGRWLTALIDGEVDALLAPVSALEQLQLQERINEIFPPSMLVPAPGSGILCCVCREDDESSAAILRQLHDADAAAEYSAEVAFVEGISAGWEHPVGALAQCRGDKLSIMGLVCDPMGGNQLREEFHGHRNDPEGCGRALSDIFLEAGATALLHGQKSDRNRPDPKNPSPSSDAEDWNDWDELDSDQD